MQYQSETDRLIGNFRKLCNVILLCWFFSLFWNALVCFTPLRLFYHHAWPKGVFYWFQGFFVMIGMGFPSAIIWCGLFYEGRSWGATNDELLEMGLVFAALGFPAVLIILRWMDTKYYGSGLYLRQRETGF